LSLSETDHLLPPAPDSRTFSNIPDDVKYAWQWPAFLQKLKDHLFWQLYLYIVCGFLSP